MSTPIPPGRGRWRVSLHRRDFTGLRYTDTIIADITAARSRRLERSLNAAASFVFTINGRSDAAKLITELQTDVIAWRWDETLGDDVPYFRGVVGQTEDQLTEQSYTINVTCHDYVAMLMRRYLTTPLNFNNVGQDSVVFSLYFAANNAAMSSGASLYPGSYLPFNPTWNNPDGTTRTRDAGVPVRIRNYAAQSDVGTMLDELAHVQNGFDYDTIPTNKNSSPDPFRIFFPQQGVTRALPILEYGSTLAGVTRTVNSSNYANYVRVLGNNATEDPNAPQVYSERVGPDANDVGRIPVGLWQFADNASDVTDQSTLDQKAQGDLNFYSVLVPSYSLALAPGAYTHGAFAIGDTLTVVVKHGRLDVNTGLRVVGMSWDISDDDTEHVGVTVGRPLTQLTDILAAGQADVNALARR